MFAEWSFQFVDKCSHTKAMATCEELIIQERWRAAVQETDLGDFLSEDLRGHWQETEKWKLPF